MYPTTSKDSYGCSGHAVPGVPCEEPCPDNCGGMLIHGVCAGGDASCAYGPAPVLGDDEE